MALISGKVLDERGQPVAGARVMFTRSPVPMPDIALMTGDDGSFMLSVPENGSYEILAATDQQGEGKTTVEVSGDHHEVEVRTGNQ
jgi:uncharacterized GH25 family protein